jgi:outer membrane protein assembly factor BamB
MKLFYFLLILIFFSSCSFDDKSGIWNSENVISKKEKDLFKDFKALNVSNQGFQKVIPITKDFRFKDLVSTENKNWNDNLFNSSNNLKNFRYNENYQLIFKSKKISKFKLDDNFLFAEGVIISSDYKGNIIIFSINENKIISKYNFYRKKYKKVKKKLNIIIENDLAYVSDNLGYIYALKYKENKILWAKKHEVAFRSNIKIYKNKIIVSNQNNQLYFINKNDGETLSIIPTEETVIKNKFQNNLSLNNKISFFINTFGSLYAVNNDTMRIIWFINLNQSLDLNPSNIFTGNQIINEDDKLVISSNEFTYIIDQKSGSTLHKLNFSNILKPIIIDNYLFAITKNKFLVALNINNGQIIYSYDLNNKIAKFLNTKIKDAEFKNLMILNGKIIIFLKNSFFLIFNINGSLEQIRKLPTKINSYPIIIDGSLMYLDKKNKLSVLD